MQRLSCTAAASPSFFASFGMPCRAAAALAPAVRAVYMVFSGMDRCAQWKGDFTSSLPPLDELVSMCAAHYQAYAPYESETLFALFQKMLHTMRPTPFRKGSVVSAG